MFGGSNPPPRTYLRCFNSIGKGLLKHGLFSKLFRSWAVIGEEEPIGIIGFSHEVVSPRDAASGLPTGKRQHKPISITKPVDAATPLLMVVLTNNENIPSATLRWYRTNRNGEEEQFYTIDLLNANVVGIRQTQKFVGPPVEEVGFVYEKITWTYEPTGASHQDDWQESS